VGALVPFAYGDALIRVIERDGDPWWVAGDVAKVLGYREAYHMVRMLDDDEAAPHIVGTLGGQQEMITISESGLYHAVLKSRRPDAKVFRKWVTAEVLPAIRKRGSYHLPRPEHVLPDPREEELDEQRQRLPSAREEALRDKRAQALAHVEARMAEGLTKSAAIAEAAEMVGRNPSTIWGWFNLVKMVPERDRGTALTPHFKGGGKFAECDPRLLESLMNRAARPGAKLDQCINQAVKQAKRMGWRPIPHRRTLRRRIEALRALPNGKPQGLIA